MKPGVPRAVLVWMVAAVVVWAILFGVIKCAGAVTGMEGGL